jgi:hypothetical protein
VLGEHVIREGKRFLAIVEKMKVASAAAGSSPLSSLA